MLTRPTSPIRHAKIALLALLVSRDAIADDGPISSLRGRRFDAFVRDSLAHHGRHDVHDIALDPEITDEPISNATDPLSHPLAAIDGDPSSAWRGAPGASSWVWSVGFRRVVHLGMIRMLLGDSATSGTPPALRWDVQLPVDGECPSWALWVNIGDRDDRHPNEFVHGPAHVHAQRQVLFANIDACALRVTIPGSRADDTEGPPVIREVSILESARPLTSPSTSVTISPWTPPLRHRPPDGPREANEATLREIANPNDIVDQKYEGLWFGAFGKAPYTIEIPLDRMQWVDRIWLSLGLDAVTTPIDSHTTGRRFGGAFLPTRYRLESSPDDHGDTFTPIEEGAPPTLDGAPLPLRRRLITLATPRPIRRLRMVIDEATGEDGNPGGTPIVREISMYSASDVHPVVQAPWFLSVDANPSGLTHRHKYGESQYDGLFARDAYHRIRRVVYGVDKDTHWTADASRIRDLGTGEMIEAIEADDPTLTRDLLEAGGVPPIVILSGSLDWDFDTSTHDWPTKPGHYSWDVLSDARSIGRGMGRLADAVRSRSAPFVGFCGGAQILALLDGAPASRDLTRQGSPNDGPTEFDPFVIRIGNEPIRGLLTRASPYERAWWSDPPHMDADRPEIFFDPSDPLFDTLGGSSRRSSSRELPSSHGDSLRDSALGRPPLRDLKVAAWSHFCRSWVREDGPEATTIDGSGRRCIRVPQAFRSTSRQGFPLIGFQFHPEQRDFTRLAPGSAIDARGDAMNVIGNAIAIALDAYVERWAE